MSPSEDMRLIIFAQSELTAASALVEARFDNPADEVRRIDTARRFLSAAMSVERALRMHTRCALVNHCGSHGTSNLIEAARGLFEALNQYANLVREAADCTLEQDTGMARPVSPRVKLEVA